MRRFATALLTVLAFLVMTKPAKALRLYPLVVSSEYQTPNGRITVSGSGIVVTDATAEKFSNEVSQSIRKYGMMAAFCERCRYYVITASHVSQGLNTRVFVNGKYQQIVGRYADIIHDIEILELKNDPTLIPQAYFFPKIQGFATFLFDLHGPDDVYDLGTDIQYHAVNVSIGPSSSVSYDFVLSPSYATCARPRGHLQNEADAKSSNTWAGLLIHNGYDESFVNAWLPPGFSGSPMFHRLDVGDRLNGIVTEYDRRLQISYLVSEKMVVSTFLDYLKNARGIKADGNLFWSWQDNGLTTYREGRDASGRVHVRETELIRGAAGSSSSGDGGHGSGGDGGHGSGGDGGHGSGGDGGHGSGGDGGNSCGDQVDLTKKLTDGLWLDGQQVFAFKLNDGSVIAADVQSYSLYRSKIQSVIPWGSELLSDFRLKLPRRLPKTSYLAQYTKKKYWGISGRPMPLVQYQLGPDFIHLMITDDAYDDALDFTVNKFGGTGSATYKRLIDVKSKNGVSYTLDLTGMFVDDFKNTGAENQIMDFAAPYVFIQREGESARYMVPVVDEGPLPVVDVGEMALRRLQYRAFGRDDK